MALILVRHGESTWNLQGRLTGWEDPELTESGRIQATHAGEVLSGTDISVAVCFTSELLRAQETARILLDSAGHHTVPVRADWHLNERHLGALQGLTKAEVTDRHGNRQRKRWRDHPDAAPPPLAHDHPSHPSNDQRYAHLGRQELPNGETRRATHQRVIKFFSYVVEPCLSRGNSVLIVTHAEPIKALQLQLGDREPPSDNGLSETPTQTVANAQILLYRDPLALSK